jgi:hypothetical protein
VCFGVEEGLSPAFDTAGEIRKAPQRSELCMLKVA